jgi:hypothetical protein
MRCYKMTEHQEKRREDTDSESDWDFWFIKITFFSFCYKVNSAIILFNLIALLLYRHYFIKVNLIYLNIYILEF